MLQGRLRLTFSFPTSFGYFQKIFSNISGLKGLKVIVSYMPSGSSDGDGESSDYKDISGHLSDYFGRTVYTDSAF